MAFFQSQHSPVNAVFVGIFCTVIPISSMGEIQDPTAKLSLSSPTLGLIGEIWMKFMKFALLTVCLVFTNALQLLAQNHMQHEHAQGIAQVVALDECDPTTFNAALGADFCKNISLGSFTTFDDLFAKAAAGHPDRNWDFEPDAVH